MSTILGRAARVAARQVSSRSSAFQGSGRSAAFSSSVVAARLPAQVDTSTIQRPPFLDGDFDAGVKKPSPRIVNKLAKTARKIADSTQEGGFASQEERRRLIAGEVKKVGFEDPLRSLVFRSNAVEQAEKLLADNPKAKDILKDFAGEVRQSVSRGLCGAAS